MVQNYTRQPKVVRNQRTEVNATKLNYYQKEKEEKKGTIRGSTWKYGQSQTD
jgi:hypothetical protein